MRDDWIFLLDFARRHLAFAEKAATRGDNATADSHRSVAAAYQLYSDESNYARARGQYLKPMMEFGTQTVPDLAYLAQASTLKNLSDRLRRTRDLARRARLADTLWEFGSDAAAAREAIAAYESIATTLAGETAEFAVFHGAAALVRANTLARALRDQGLVTRLTEVTVSQVEQLAPGSEHAALINLAELLVEVGGADDSQLARLELALERHAAGLPADTQGTFNIEQHVLEILVKVAGARKNEKVAGDRNRRIGESIAREGEWKLAEAPNGGLVAGFFLEKAAKHFDGLGDRQRAAELRERERVALKGAEFHTIESEVEIDLGPYRRWLEKLFDANGPEAFWLGWLISVPLPTDDEIAAMSGEGSIVDLFGMSTIDDDLIVDSPDPAESRDRRNRGYAYVGVRGHVYTLFGVARDVFKVEAASAESVLMESGRFDDTARQLLKRFLTAVDQRDWVAAAYLSGPVFEKIVRSLGEAQKLPIRGPEKTGRRITYRPLDDILRRLTLEPALKTFALYVLSYPGLNLRNEVSHALLDAEACKPDLAALLLFLLCALSFGIPLETTSPPAGTD